MSGRSVSGSLRSALFITLLFGVNVYVCRELFRIEYLNQMGSIEGAYIGLARYIMHHARDLTWFPLWYNGIPWQNAYPPLLHETVALVAAISQSSPARSYHFVVALLYCSGPVTLFLLCFEFSGNRAYSFFVGLLYSILSPAAFVIAQVREEIGLLRPRRLQALVAWGEGPHIAALTLLPLALLCLHRTVTRRRPIDFFLAAILFAAIAMTNWLGAVALFAATGAYICSTDLRAVPIAMVTAAAAYGIASPWLPPSTIRTIHFNAPLLGDYGSVYSSLPEHLAVISLFAIGLVMVIRRLTHSLLVRFSAIFAFLMASVVLPTFWWKLSIVPQSDRYQLEMELGLAIFAIFALKPLIDRIPRRARIALAIAAAVAAIIPAKSDRRFARYLIAPVRIDRTIEYQTALWIDRNLKLARVFSAGSTQFWLNAFTDTPELTGGFDNGVVDQPSRIARSIVTTGDGTGNRHAAIAILWLKAFGVQAAVIAGPNTTQAYRDFRNPAMFDGFLTALWHKGDDTIYRIPQRSTSLARVVRGADLVARTPTNGLDTAPLEPYVAALDDASLPLAHFEWRNNHHAVIRSDLSPRQVVSVQIAYHPGWHARVSGAEKTVHEDGIGLMYVEAGCTGACQIDLVYDGGAEMRLARAAAAGTWLILAGLVLAPMAAEKLCGRSTPSSVE